MIRHLPFYFAEATLITFMVWLGLFLSVSALRRTGITIQPRWTITLVSLWLVIACVDAVVSEKIGPEFTLLFYFGIWTLVAGGVLWFVVRIRQGAAALRQRFVRQAPPSK